MSGIDLIDGTPVLDIKPYIPAYDTVERTKEDLEDAEIYVGDVLEKSCKNDQRTDELLERLQAGEEGLKVRPVGEAEHRENLLDFVNWATRSSNDEATGGSAAEKSGNIMKSSHSTEQTSLKVISA